MALDEADKRWIDDALQATEKSIVRLMMEMKESLEREVGEVKQTVHRMEARLGKIAAGSHYVTRLVEWSESQDAFQADILRRVQALERKLESHNGGA